LTLDGIADRCYDPYMSAVEEKPWSQVERILRSQTFRASSALPRLLRFLADKSFAGEADQLKEYTIGIDAFGKPPTYDPRQDAIVRLQIGRLRQKLAEYYRTEGKDDPVIMELPKGRFKLIWECRSTTVETAPLQKADAPSTTGAGVPAFLRYVVPSFAGALLIAVIWVAWLSAQLRNERRNELQASPWTPELEQLWRPFVTGKRPLIVSIADPLFVGFEGTDSFFRKKSLNRPEDAASSPEVLVLRKALGNPNIQPTFNFTPRGEVISSFLLAKLLGTRRQDISFTRSSQLPLQELAENNVLLVGPESVFDRMLPGMQLDPQFVPAPAGIRNLHPRPGEPGLFPDSPQGPAPDDGEVYALISHAPGPLGSTDIQSFTSSRTWGRQGAVQVFTDPMLARTLVGKLKRPSGEISRYYQIVVKVKFMDGLPTEISYVLHRDLAPR